MGARKEALNFDEIVHNTMLMASRNDWYGDIIRAVISHHSKGGLAEQQIRDHLVNRLAAEQGRQPREIDLPPEKVRSVVGYLTDCKVLERSKQGRYSLSDLARRYLPALKAISRSPQE